MRILPLAAMSVLLLSPVSAKEPEAVKHTVWIWQETGDCLWNLAKKYYGDPFKWKIIYEANKNLISDPRVIFPKQILEIPSLESVSKKKAEAAKTKPEKPAAEEKKVTREPSPQKEEPAQENIKEEDIQGLEDTTDTGNEKKDISK
jgi:hypothetical protein